MIVTDNEFLAKKAKHLSTQAKADNFEYYHDHIGYNYRLTNVSAAIGLAQMEQLNEFIEKKHFIKDFYIKNLKNVGDIEFQKVENHIHPNWWLFTIKSKKQVNYLSYLIKINFNLDHLIPMNQLPMFKDELYINESNFSQKFITHLLSIPCSMNIKIRI